MGDQEGDNPASKKRVAGRQISKENPELDDDGPEPEIGTFKKASDEVLATRRIVKVRRTQHPPPEATSNPFASLRMVAPSNSSEEVKGKEETETESTCEEKAGKEKLENANKEVDSDKPVPSLSSFQQVKGKEETETESTCEEKAGKEKLENANKEVDSDKPVPSLSSFQQLSSSQNAFTGLAGTGFGAPSFSFGSISKTGPAFSAGSFGAGGPNNGNVMQEVPVETGEENEKLVFTADAILYEYLDGGWKERGKGELKLNISTSGAEKARLIMRARGNYRLILNASLYPDMALASMDKKGVTFACINSAGEGKDGLSTFALKFKDSSFVEEFRGAVEAHKGKKTAVLKTPENSPEAADD